MKLKLNCISSLAITIWCNTTIPSMAQERGQTQAQAQAETHAQLQAQTHTRAHTRAAHAPAPTPAPAQAQAPTHAHSNANANAKKSAPANTASSGSIQEFIFPATSIGTLSKCEVVDDWQNISAPTPLAGAFGRVTLKLAPREASILHYNSRIIKSPQLMDQFSADNLDGIWIDFVNMENEKSISDNFVVHSRRFPHLKILLIDRSDATDAGLLQLPRMAGLYQIHASMTAVTGEFLQHADRFPALKTLVLFNTPINSQSLSNLPNLRNLVDLDLQHTSLKPSAMNFIGQCEKLKHLRISENPSLDDACLSNLNNLKKLDWLEMTKVAVTMKGLRALRPIAANLHILHLPGALAVNQKELAQLFPNCKLQFSGRPNSVDPLIDSICAPLK